MVRLVKNNTLMTQDIVSAALVKWCKSHKPATRVLPYLSLRDGTKMSLAEIAAAVEEGTEVGISFRDGLLNLTVELLMREKTSILGPGQVRADLVLNTYPEVRPTVYGKYLVKRQDKIHFEVWNGTGWAYNDKTITMWCEIPNLT